jgi:hypothetical protein
MVTYSTDARRLARIARTAIGAALLGAGALLAGCTVATRHLSSDFGSVLKEDVAAQVSDPDAHYVGAVAPGSNGARAALAQGRYERDAVKRPTSAQTSTVKSGGGGGGGGGDEGGSAE